MSASRLDYRVRAVNCDYRAGDEEVYQALKRATDPLERSWAKLTKAKRIGVKFNQDKMPERTVLYEGQRQQLVTDKVARATLRLLREKTTADLFCIDVSFYQVYSNALPNTTNLAHVLREFNVEYVNGNESPVVWQQVPGGGRMFEQYPVHERSTQADAFVSVQKMKNHAFMGVTLCLKNLFGLMPTQPLGRPRFYYHHLVRMPYMLVDIGRIYNPALNILDATICQAGEEWGNGEEPRITNTLVAGDHVIATDAVGTYLMGHDPQSDWLTAPFHRDRNPLLIAAQSGFGTVNLDEIDYDSEVQAPLATFFAKNTDSQSTVVAWRRSTAEQALWYLDHQHELKAQYPGEYILLQMGEVKWHDSSGMLKSSRRLLSGDHPDQAMWLKFIDPDEPEKEHYEVYEHTLAQIKAMEPQLLAN